MSETTTVEEITDGKRLGTEGKACLDSTEYTAGLLEGLGLVNETMDGIGRIRNRWRYSRNYRKTERP